MTNVVLVTGANKGIGRGLVKSYLQRPNTTVVAAVRFTSSYEAKSLGQLHTALQSRVILVQINAQSDTDAKDAVKILCEQHGIQKLDIVIANAGIFSASANQKVLDLRLADLQEHVDVNAYSVIRLFQATYPLLKESHKPTFLLNSAGAATMSGMKTFANFPLNSYSASKMMANFFVMRLHMEHPNLIVFAIHPGSVVTANRTAAAQKLGVPIDGLSVAQCVESMLHMVDRATLATTSGTFLNIDGTPIPW